MGGSSQQGKITTGSPSLEDKLTSGSSRPDKMVVGSPSLANKVTMGSSLKGKIREGSLLFPGKVTMGSLLPDKDMVDSSFLGKTMAGFSFSLPAFYEAIADDVRIGPTHICLYVALLNEWDMAWAKEAIPLNRNALMKKDSIALDRNVQMKMDAIVLDKNALIKKDSIPLNRKALMKNARISRRTYHKCMRELHEYGYIKYEPSNNPCFRSRVYLKRL